MELATSLMAVADGISPLAQNAAPFTPTTTVDAAVATAGGTTTNSPSPDPATYHRSEDLKKLTNKIVIHANVRAEVGNTFPRRRQLPPFRSFARGRLGSANDDSLRALRRLAESGRGRFRSQRRLAPAGAAAFALPRAFFASRLGSASLITARRFCAVSCRSLFITADTTAAIFRP
jgi:hypothetical protein